jgi:hypothetical protein
VRLHEHSTWATDESHDRILAGDKESDGEMLKGT